MRFVDSKCCRFFCRGFPGKVSAKPKLHIIVPGACGPLAEIVSLKNSQIVDGWINTLSKSRCEESSDKIHHVISSLFNLSPEADFPSAALVMLANDSYDSSVYYMHADPVHLQADLDHAVLTSSDDLDITEEESIALCDELNQHFNQDGLTFFRLNKNQWFVSGKNKIKLNTTSLTDATGRNINFIMPDGSDSASWKQVLTEAQMLMHAHEVNNSRESTGQLSINSLWFHGPGPVPKINNSESASICSNHDMFKGLAGIAKCDYLKVPGSVNDYAQHLLSRRDNNTVNILHLSELEHLINYTDVTLWRDKLTDVLTNWVYPLIKIANENNIEVVIYPCNKKRYHFSKYDSLKFWRQGTIDQHIKCY